MFYFIYKIIIFSDSKEKDDIYEALTVNSHNSEKINHITSFSYFIAL